MKLSFQQVDISNFKCFVGDGHSLALHELDAGLHFLRGRNRVEPRLGSNGAGKTSLWDAVCWCLYGRTPNGLRNPDIKPWRGKGKTMVSVLVQIDDEPHEVTRTANPNGLLIDTKEAGQETVDELLGISYGVFTNTILLGQGQPLFFDLQPRDKMQLFTEVLALDRWDGWAKVASEVAIDLERMLAGMEGERTGITASLEQVGKMLKTATEQAAEWEADRQDKLAGFDKERKECAVRHKKAKAAQDEADIAYDGAATELKHFREKKDQLHEELRTAQAAVGSKEAEIRLLKKQHDGSKEELAAFGPGDSCPICGQSLRGTHLVKFKADLKAKLTDLRQQIDAGVSKKLTTAVRAAQNKLDEYRRYELEHEAKAEKALQVLNTMRPLAAELQTRMSTLDAQIKEWEGEADPFREQVSQLKKRKTSLTREDEELVEAITKLGRRIERTRFWVRGFKNIRLYIVEDVLQQLELTTNAMLDDVGLLEWGIQYAVEKETKAGTIQRGLSMSILSPANKSAVRWESWSGGEGQRLRLIGALALSEVLLNYAGVETDLEILDEPTRHLSGEGVRDLCDFLSARAVQLDRKTWYVDHQSVESARFASVWTVVKDKQGAHLE